MSNMYGRQVVLPLVNKSGGGVVAGDVVIIDTSNDGAFTTTTTGAYQGSLGVAQETIGSNATGRVLVMGYAALVNVPASVTRGHFVKTHTVAKQATGNSTRQAGSFGQFLTGGTTPTAWLWGFPDNAGASGETLATSTLWDAAGDLVVGTGADTAARLAIGTTGQQLTSNGTTATWSAANRLIDIAHVVRTAGNLTLNGTTWAETAAATGGPGTGGFDIDLTPVVTGDIVEYALSGYFNNAATYAFFTVATIVSASPVNYFGGNTGSTTGSGIPAWAAVGGREETKGGSIMYTLQSGDISGGSVKLRLYHRTSAATNRTLFAGTTEPFNISAKVFRP